MPSIQDQITAYLTSQHLSPSASFLSTFIPTIRPNTPLVALQKTALFRILASDLRVSLDLTTASTFPSSSTDPNAREQHLACAVTVQVLDVEDLGRSRWSQVESLEAVERGEMKKGQEIIRVVPSEEHDGDNSGGVQSSSSAGPHKLLLQDGAGREVYGLEVSGVKGVGLQMAMGSKVVVHAGATVARGVVLLEPGRCEVLGGKVDSWDRKWREERKSVLKQRAGWTADAISTG